MRNRKTYRFLSIGLRKIFLQGLVLLLVTIFFAREAKGQPAQDAYRPGSLFEAKEALGLTLKTDLPSLLKDRGEDRGEHPASIAYSPGEDTVVMQDLKIQVRGNYRRLARHCGFPPLRLNFSKKEAEGTLFEGQDKLKLVVPCQEQSETYENYVLLEYLAYRIYNQLTDFSFKVRLVKMTFEDSSGKRDLLTSYAFLIEDEDAMAERNGGEILEQEGLNPLAMDKSQAALLSIFQYMIGNTDWHIPSLHNIKLVRRAYYAFPYPTPYDFDYTGLVNTEYAVPHEELPIERVTQRYYRGICLSPADLEAQIALFIEKKEAIYALFEELKPLNDRYRRNALRYLDEFYAFIDKPRQVRRVIGAQCQRGN